MEIAYLNQHPAFIPRLAEHQAEEWQHLYLDWDAVVANAEFAAQHCDGRLPTTLIALEKGDLLGSVSVIHDDLPEWGQLNPWLASLFVLPNARRRGVGGALVAAAETLMINNNVASAFLFTETRRHWFEGLGWRWFAETEVLVFPAVIMTKTFPSCTTK